MWCLLCGLVLACGAAVAEGAPAPAEGAPTPATTRAPPRTLDRKAAELAWHSWLKSPESGNQNAPPRRITTKSLFITPLVCPKGQRLDRNGCVEVVTVNKDEHERILLEQLNALFTSAPGGDVIYDYGDEEPGPLQLSIPIGLDPLAAPLQAPEPSAQAQDLQPVKDKKDKPDIDYGIEAELELLKLQQTQDSHNDTATLQSADSLNHNGLLPDKPKRDSPVANSTESEPVNDSDEGQKELVFGQVNVDPILAEIESQALLAATTETEEMGDKQTKDKPTDNINTDDKLTEDTQLDVKETKYKPTEDKHTDNEKPTGPSPSLIETPTIIFNISDTINKTQSVANAPDTSKGTVAEIIVNTTMALKKDGVHSKLNPENDYADIGEAIKLISRYAEVTTDDSFAKDQKKNTMKDDSVLGTRTKLQHRRNKVKPEVPEQPSHVPLEHVSNQNMPVQIYPKSNAYYRYPWSSQHPTPPPQYPFRHLQDYWQGRSQIGGVYKSAHGNPRRHHHTYNYFKPHGYPFGYPEPYHIQDAYPGLHALSRRASSNHRIPVQSYTNNQDLYTLLGLRHWFSSEGTSKR